MKIRVLLYAVLAIALCQTAFAYPIVMFDNLNQPVANSQGTETGILVAQRFNTGEAGIVEQILVTMPLLWLQNWSNTEVPVNSTGTVSLYYDNAGLPGAVKETLTPVTNTRFISTPQMVASNTLYWVVLAGTTADDSIQWPWTNCTGLDTPDVGCPANNGPVDPLSAINVAGGGWTSFNTPQLMEVELTPEPSTFLLAFGALGVLLGAKRLRRS